jgi:hypothetical protein
MYFSPRYATPRVHPGVLKVDRLEGVSNQLNGRRLQGAQTFAPARRLGCRQPNGFKTIRSRLKTDLETSSGPSRFGGDFKNHPRRIATGFKVIVRTTWKRRTMPNDFKPILKFNSPLTHSRFGGGGGTGWVSLWASHSIGPDWQALLRPDIS